MIPSHLSAISSRDKPSSTSWGIIPRYAARQESTCTRAIPRASAGVASLMSITSLYWRAGARRRRFTVRYHRGVTTPMVLFVCVHNAGRSQMAAGYLQQLAGDRVDVRSAGSAPADGLNPVAVDAMAEDGIDITATSPRLLTVDDVRQADVVITMGCGDACPVFPGKRYEDWELDDPAGQGLDGVRPIRDEIRSRVVTLLASLDVSARPDPAC